MAETSDKTMTVGEMPAWALLAMVLAAGALGMWSVVGSGPAFVTALGVVLTDGVMTLLVLVAAGGYGYAAYRLVAPEGIPSLLAVATAASAGLWLLGTAVLVVGTFLDGALTAWVWWPVVAIGVGLALLQAHRALGKAQLPRRFAGASLVWVLVAAGAGIWLGGVAMPPGVVGGVTGDSYDVLEYHLQLPREYYDAGRVSTLDHNVYSHYPLGVEMLYLLGMCLRGGPYMGAYAAKMMGGLFAIVAIAGVFGALRKEEDFRARAAAALLASAPWTLYLCSIAMVEPAQLCYLTLALLWLRRWLAEGGMKDALWIGVMLGASCAVKYLSVGFIVAPVLVVMVLAGVRRVRRIGQAALAGVVALLFFAPWLARNVVATGNPVFPLATTVLGQGHWPDDCAQRWTQGHAPQAPQIREAPDLPPRQLTRREAFVRLLGGRNPYDSQPPLGPAYLLTGLALAALVAMLLRPRTVGGWDWSLPAVLAVQFFLWAFFTHEMPARFICVSLVPLSLLAAGGLARLANVKEIRWLRQPGGIGGRWGMAPAGILLAGAATLNLLSAGAVLRWHLARWGIPPNIAPAGLPVESVAAAGRKYPSLAIVGEATAFYLPAGTVYATVFDKHPLQDDVAAASDSADFARRVALRGITHLRIGWAEIDRLEGTYGWPPEMSAGRLTALTTGWPVDEENWVVSPDSEPVRQGRAKPALGFTVYAVPEAAMAAASQPTSGPQ